ncbi:MAG: SAM-dependent chlorinase/fluorinase [Candidatus Dormibacteraeota bacterium]|nr:SAM-dependent chlorinase/fluorinase [Candidatus Dormibacteraeota bacterium]
MAAILTLLTDFGTDSGYGGAMLGAVLRAAPGLRVEVITHGVPPTDIGAGAYWLAACAPAFPDGTVHCAVVDPGVGSDRPLVAAAVDGQLVVAPDNGLLHFLWQRGKERSAFRIAIAPHLPAQLSGTFHGRDLIGPLAARLATGELALEELGPRVPSPSLLPGLLPQGDAEGTWAQVVVVDHFGNAILAVAQTPWYAPQPASVTAPGGREVRQVVRSYHEIESGLAILWNSAGHLEIAGNRVNAARELKLSPGDKVRVTWEADSTAGRGVVAGVAVR